jgi:hypothetical protein
MEGLNVGTTKTPAMLNHACLSLDEVYAGACLDRSTSNPTPPCNSRPGAARHIWTPPASQLTKTASHFTYNRPQNKPPIYPDRNECCHPHLAFSLR